MAYFNRHADNISRLILDKGRSAADAQRRSGEAWGNAVATTGRIAAGAITDYAQHQADEPKRKLLDARIKDETRELRGRDMLHELGSRLTDPQTGHVDTVTLAKELRTAGYSDLADGVEQKVRAQSQQALSDLHARVKAHETAFGQGTQLLQELQKDPTQYANVRPMIVNLANQLDPQLAAHVPETYDANAVKQMLDFTIAGATQATTRARALSTLKAANDASDDALKRTELQRKALAGWLSTATSQEDWNASLATARQMHIDEAVIGQFGAWSDDAPTRANDVLLTPEQRAKRDEGPTPGSKEDVYASYAREFLKGRPVRTMTASEKTKAEAWWGERTRLSERGGDGNKGGITPAQKNTIERWKFNQLNQLEAQFAKSQSGGGGLSITNPDGTTVNFGGGTEKTPMTVEQMDKAKLHIENTYRLQLGLEPLKALGPGWGTKPAADAPPPTSTPALPSASGKAAPPAPPTDVRAQAQATLAKFNAEKDPAKKEALRQQLIQFRTQLTGAQ